MPKKTIQHTFLTFQKEAFSSFYIVRTNAKMPTARLFMISHNGYLPESVVIDSELPLFQSNQAFWSWRELHFSRRHISSSVHNIRIVAWANLLDVLRRQSRSTRNGRQNLLADTLLMIVHQSYLVRFPVHPWSCTHLFQIHTRKQNKCPAGPVDLPEFLSPTFDLGSVGIMTEQHWREVIMKANNTIIPFMIDMCLVCETFYHSCDYLNRTSNENPVYLPSIAILLAVLVVLFCTGE